MKVLKIYSGHLRSWIHNKRNHQECLGFGDEVHYSDLGRSMDWYNADEFNYSGNKAGETTPASTLNQWHNMWNAFCLAPKGYDVYVRMRYDIRLTGAIDFTQYDLSDNKIYIPRGHDYHDGVNDQMAFGNFQAIRKYYNVYLLHPLLFEKGKRFHTESYLKYALDEQGVKIIRLPIETEIIR